MSEVLELEPKPSADERRARIESELRENPQRSDREIGRVVGADHKTVGAARERMRIATPPGNMGAVDVVLPNGVVSLPPDIAKAVQGAEDQCRGAILRERKARNDKSDAAGEENQECTLLMPRKETTIQHNEKFGCWIIKQRNWPDEDAEIWINDEDMHDFVDRLTDHLGYGSAP